MAYELLLTSRGLLRCRFAISPIWETTHLVKLLYGAGGEGAHLPWLADFRSRAAGLDLTDLVALQPARGWTPDFLTPTPDDADTTIEAQLDGVRRAPPDAVAEDLRRTLRDQPVPALRARITRLLADPAAARDELAGHIRACWDAVVRPDWERLRELLAADVARHSRVLADGGLEALLPALHPNFRLAGDTLVVAHATDDARDVPVPGLVLMPSAFVWPGAAVMLEVAVPTVVYPARGAADLGRRPRVHPAGLGGLIGATRAKLLADLDAPASTTALAKRHDLSPSGVSAHLTVLRDNGLVTASRHRHSVLYRRTELGSRLVDPA
jgi:DNA-binding transcriptional ArsR family regulator